MPSSDRHRRKRLYWQQAAAIGLVKGECPFPPMTKPPDKTPRYFVPAGTSCIIINVASGKDVHYCTKLSLGFERYERYRGGYYRFRQEGWWLVIHRRFVKHRDDGFRLKE